jgi:hypothetical protein
MPARARPTLLARLVFAGVVATIASLGLPAAGQALAPSCPTSSAPADDPHAPLRFGIYPGGPAGSVDPKAPPRPEDPAKRLSALQALAGANPFVVRLYSAWTGNPGADDVSAWLDPEIAGYTVAGLQVELVVRYRPLAGDTVTAPAGFAQYVRSLVRRYGGDPRFVSLQVTNEANIPGAPDASDGAYAGAAQALVQGVVAAADQKRLDGRAQLGIGFSWAYDERPSASTDFWRTLGQLGGPAFAGAVDWVGLDSYPGTWSPFIALSDLLPGLAGSALTDSIRALRTCFMPLAGLGAATSLHVAENGFPTGPGRSDDLQARTLDAMVRAVDGVRGRYGVTDYRWFDLRDSSSADSSIESQYGITRDDYSPKPAFATYRDIVARGGAGGGPGGGGTGAGPDAPGGSAADCQPSPVKVAVPRWKSRRVTSLVIQAGKKVVKRVRARRLPRSVRVRLRSGRATLRLKLTARGRGGKRLHRVARRTYRVC